jgi:hypothetical protein
VSAISETKEEPSINDYLSSASFKLKGPLPPGIINIYSLLFELVSKFSKPEKINSSKLFLLGFSSWRNSLLLAQAGASSQVPICLRHSIECGLHAYLFDRNPRWAETWWARELDPASKKKLRDGRRGPLKEARDLLESENKVLHVRATEFIELMIDFGAHPNIFQLIDVYSESRTEEADSKEIRVSFLSGNENRERALVKCGAAGLLLADFFRIIWPSLINDSTISQRQAECAGQMRVYSNSIYHEQNWSK